MNKDLYKILGVPRSASAAEIKKKYRELARKYHPDVNKSPEAEQTFKEITAAHAVLGNPEKRERYDKFGINGLRDGFSPNGGFGGGFGDLDEILGSLFGGRSPFGGGFGGSPFGNMGRQRQQASKGADLEATISITAQQSLNGGKLFVQHLGKSITLPSNIYDGQKIRIAGQGQMGRGGKGDLFLVLIIKPESPFLKFNHDLLLPVPVTIFQAYKGAKIPVLLPEGDVKNISILPRTQGGQRFRLKGKGLPLKGGSRSDLYVQIQIRIPKEESIELEETFLAVEEFYSTED